MSARSTAVATMDRDIDTSQSRAIAAREIEQTRPRTALEAMASRLQVDPKVLTTTLRNTAFAACKTNEEFVALVIVANTYGLNPLLKEIYAFPGKGGGITPMVGVDGWMKLMNSHPQFDGIEFIDITDAKGTVTAIEAIIYRKDRAHATKIIEYLEECRRGTEPWKQMPRRMLRNRVICQAARLAFGFSGISVEGDEDVVETIQSLPARNVSRVEDRSMGELIDDSIPDHDEETGEVIEENDADATQTTASTAKPAPAKRKAPAASHSDEPSRDEQTGMTEVDEETARSLDAGETDDEPEPENAAEADEEGPAAQRLREFRERAAAATSLPDLTAIDAEWCRGRAGFDDEDAAAMDKFITQRTREIRDGGAK